MGRDRALSIIRLYYEEGSDAFRALIVHGDAIAGKARRLMARNPELSLDAELVEEGAYLHDIGISGTSAAGIGCHGPAPYLMHGIIGGDRLMSVGLPAHARIAERHIGVGLTRAEIIVAGLPLPPRDMLPETLEEQVICFLDLFFSKTPGRMAEEKRRAHIRQKLARFGERHAAVFDGWCRRFREP